MTRERRATADLDLCRHEIERLRAQLQLDAATIRRQARRIRQLERDLGERPQGRKT